MALTQTQRNVRPYQDVPVEKRPTTAEIAGNIIKTGSGGLKMYSGWLENKALSEVGPDTVYESNLGGEISYQPIFEEKSGTKGVIGNMVRGSVDRYSVSPQFKAEYANNPSIITKLPELNDVQKEILVRDLEFNLPEKPINPDVGFIPGQSNPDVGFGVLDNADNKASELFNQLIPSEGIMKDTVVSTGAKDLFSSMNPLDMGPMGWANLALKMLKPFDDKTFLGKLFG